MVLWGIKPRTELLNECCDYRFLGLRSYQFQALMVMSPTRLKLPIPNENLILEASSAGHWITCHIMYIYTVTPINCRVQVEDGEVQAENGEVVMQAATVLVAL